MRADLDAKLCADFPNLYRDRNASMQTTCMCWGFEVGDAWEPLIRDLSAKLETMIMEQPPGEREFYAAAQVKEKYGTLRFYMTSSTEEMDKAIEEAERVSAVTCESCGAPGKLGVVNYWWSVRCDGCREAAK